MKFIPFLKKKSIQSPKIPLNYFLKKEINEVTLFFKINDKESFFYLPKNSGMHQTISKKKKS